MEKKKLITALIIAFIAMIVIGAVLLIGLNRKDLFGGRSNPFFPSADGGQETETPVSQPAMTDTPAPDAMVSRMEALQKENEAILETMELADRERETLREELKSAKELLAVSTEEKTAWKDEAQRLYGELDAVQSDIQTLSAEKTALEADLNTALAQVALAAQSAEEAGWVSQIRGESAIARFTQQTEELSQEVNSERVQTLIETLRQRVDELNAEKADVQAALDAALFKEEELQAQFDALQTKAADDAANMDAQAEAISMQLDAAVQEKDTLQAELDAAQTELDALRKQAEALKTENQAVADAETEKLNEQITVLNNQLASAQAALKAAEEENNALKQEKDALNEQLAAAAQSLTTLSSQLTESARQQNSLEDQLSAAAAEITALKGQTDEAAGENAALRTDLAFFQASLTAAQEQIETMKAQGAELSEDYNSQVTASAQANEALQQENASLQDELNAALAASAAAQGEANAWRTQYETADEALTAASEERDQLNQQLAALDTRLTLTQDALTEAEEAVKTLQKEKAELDAQLVAVIQEGEALSGQLAATVQAKDALADQLSASDEANSALQANVDALQVAVSTAQATADALRIEAEEKAAEWRLKLTALQETLQETESALSDSQQENVQAAEKIAALNTSLTETQNALTAETETGAALAAQVIALEESWTDTKMQLQAETEQNDALRGQLAALLAGLYSRPVLPGETPDFCALVRQSIGLENKTAALLELPAAVTIGTDENDPVLLTVNGEAIRQSETDAAAQSAVNIRQLFQRVLPAGTDLSGIPENRALAVAQMIQNRVLWQQAEAAGLAQLSAEDLETLNAAARQGEETYQIPAEVLLPELAANLVLTRLWEYAGQDAVLPEEEYNQALREKIAADEALYAADPDAFAKLLETEGAVYYTLPAAYRYVKHIFLPVSLDQYNQRQEELQEAEHQLTTAERSLLLAYAADDPSRVEKLKEEISALQSRIAALPEELEALNAQMTRQTAVAKLSLKNINESIEAGNADVDELIAQYSADTSMPVTGYAVCEASTQPFEAFVTESLAISDVGMWSPVLEAEDGYHLMYCAQELSSDGNQVIQAAAEQLKADMQTAKCQEASDAVMVQWIAQTEIVMNASSSD